MEDWQREFYKMLDEMTETVDEFVQNLIRDVGKAADEFVDFSEGIAEQIEHTIASELDKFDEQLDDWVEPMLQAITMLESALGNTTEPVSQTIEPILNEHPVCIGCRHYHGQSYNGVMFVCAMHPYGVAEGDESCPDKDTHPWIPKNNDFFDDHH
jgi:uncharacterized membrane protein YheB (UPF0754 family)